MLSKEALLAALEGFPPKAKRIWDDYKELVLKSDLVAAGVRCQHCEGYGHYVGDCLVLSNKQSLVTNPDIDGSPSMLANAKSAFSNAFSASPSAKGGVLQKLVGLKIKLTSR